MKGAGTRFPVLLDPRATECAFPDVSLALSEPNGLLAVGGNLGPDCLLEAYRHGIFPWYEAGQPILWWSPDPRMVLFPAALRVSRSLHKVIRQQRFRVTFDRAFDAVIQACSAPRDKDHSGTWITGEMIAAYQYLHLLGHAHSVEAWQDDELVGGVYGVSLGRVFFGESMFHRRSDASKVAFVHLVRRLEARGCDLIDCQMETPHLASLGAEAIPRREFTGLLSACDQPGIPLDWQDDP